MKEKALLIMNDKVEFVHYSDTFGPLIMEATTWPEAVSELYNEGFANSGKRKVVKRTYKWVSDEPHIIDTNVIDEEEGDEHLDF